MKSTHPPHPHFIALALTYQSQASNSAVTFHDDEAGLFFILVRFAVIVVYLLLSLLFSVDIR
jgi:hypothetical protein